MLRHTETSKHELGPDAEMARLCPAKGIIRRNVRTELPLRIVYWR